MERKNRCYVSGWKRISQTLGESLDLGYWGVQEGESYTRSSDLVGGSKDGLSFNGGGFSSLLARGDV